MTRKRAIEAALVRLADGADECFMMGMERPEKALAMNPIEVHEELEAMHALGRLAGLREAARIAQREFGLGKTAAYLKLREALAKKARGK